MDTRFAYRAAYDALMRAARLLIVSHKKPDGDTLGSAAAVLNFCRSRGISSDAFCLDVVPDQYLYLPGTESFIADKNVFGQSFDTVAVFDAGDLRFAGIADFVEGMPQRPFIINFDHHATNEFFGDVNVVGAGASSTAEVIYDFFRFCGVEINQKISTCLLTGIFTDTASFSNPATTSASLEAAADLLRRGAKIQEVCNRLLRNKSLAALRLWGQAFSRLKYNSALGIASTVIFADDLRSGGIDDDHIDGIADFLNNFLDVKILLILRELPDGKVKGSFRTAHDADVSVIAKILGGGGHKKAAGFTIPGRIVEATGGWRVE